jgi:hypothetical protein
MGSATVSSTDETSYWTSIHSWLEVQIALCMTREVEARTSLSYGTSCVRQRGRNKSDYHRICRITERVKDKNRKRGLCLHTSQPPISSILQQNSQTGTERSKRVNLLLTGRDEGRDVLANWPCRDSILIAPSLARGRRISQLYPTPGPIPLWEHSPMSQKYNSYPMPMPRVSVQSRTMQLLYRAGFSLSQTPVVRLQN